MPLSSALVTTDFFQTALGAISTFVVTLDQHPFGALVLTVLLIAVVVLKKLFSASLN